MSHSDADKPTNLDDEQLSTLAHSIGAAARTATPLEVTLAALAEERENPRLAAVARRLSVLLEGGATIDEAVAAMGPQLPPEYAGLLRAGVESGNLAGTIDQFAHQRLAARRVRLRIRRTLAYPLLILAILVPIALFMSLFVIPIFGQMYREFDLALPKLSILVLIVAQRLPLWIFTLFVILFGLPMLLRLVGGRWLTDRVWSAVPLLGRLSMWSSQREFAAMLASFLDSRLPLTSDWIYERSASRPRLGAGLPQRRPPRRTRPDIESIARPIDSFRPGARGPGGLGRGEGTAPRSAPRRCRSIR